MQKRYIFLLFVQLLHATSHLHTKVSHVYIPGHQQISACYGKSLLCFKAQHTNFSMKRFRFDRVDSIARPIAHINFDHLKHSTDERIYHAIARGVKHMVYYLKTQIRDGNLLALDLSSPINEVLKLQG